VDLILERDYSKQKTHEKINKIPLEYKDFPSMKDFNNIFPVIAKRQSKLQEIVWESKVKGTPAAVEALFNMIERGETETGKFRYGLKHCSLNEEQLFAHYEKFVLGECDESLLYINRKGFKKE